MRRQDGLSSSMFHGRDRLYLIRDTLGSIILSSGAVCLRRMETICETFFRFSIRFILEKYRISEVGIVILILSYLRDLIAQTVNILSTLQSM